MSDKALNEYIARLLAKADTNLDDLLKGYDLTLLSDFNEARKQILSIIAWMYEKYGDDVDMQKMQQKNRLINLEAQIDSEIKSLTNGNIKYITDDLKKLVSESYSYTGFALETSIKADLGFGLLNPKTIQAAVLNPFDKVTWPEALQGHAETYSARISKEIRQGLIKGQGYSKTAGNVTELTDKYANKTYRIVRTESHRVQNLGRILAYNDSQSSAEDLGLSTRRIWVSTLDERTRPVPGKKNKGYEADHRFMDGKAADEDGYFTLKSGVRTLGPGLSGIAEEDINCRCSTRLEIVGYETKFRKDNISKKIISYKTFEEWKKGRRSA